MSSASTGDYDSTGKPRGMVSHLLEHTFKVKHEEQGRRDWEMAPMVKPLPCKQRDLSSDPSTQVKVCQCASKSCTSR